MADLRPYPQPFGVKKGIPGDEQVFTLLNESPICGTKHMGMKLFEFLLAIPTFAGGGPRSQGPDRVIG